MKWKGQNGDREVYGLILEPGNLIALKKGHPIYIYKEEWVLPFDLVIDFFAGNKKELMEKMRAGGVITAQTIIHDESERKKS